MIAQLGLMLTSSRIRGQEGLTLLMYAMDKGDKYMLSALIALEVDLNCENAVGSGHAFLE